MGKMAVEIGATALNQYGGGWTRSRSRCSLEFQVLSRPGPQINIWLLHKLQGATKLLKRRKVIFSLSFAAAKLCSSASTAPPNAPPESAHCWWYPLQRLFRLLQQLLLAADAFGSGRTDFCGSPGRVTCTFRCLPSLPLMLIRWAGGKFVCHSQLRHREK